MTDVVLSLGPGAGRLRGSKDDASGVCRFLGVPYALPPVGARRWRKPEPLPRGFSYDDDDDGKPRDCTKFGPVCPQQVGIVDGHDAPGITYSEDCLTVNIWTPDERAPPEGRRRPVLVFIHGGWLQIGDPSVADRCQPHELLSRQSSGGAGLDAVVVSIGYRLNVFGFLAGRGVDGNFGFWDQRAALQWVQEYIPFFGGDPSMVTLSGVSAGAYSAHTQLQYELLHTDGSKPLFKNVFLCSNAIPAQPKSCSEADSQLQNLYEVLGLGGTDAQRLEELRKVSAEDLVAALPKLVMSNFRAVTDDDMIGGDMVARFEDGTFARRFLERGYRLMTGEADREQFRYAQWLPPKTPADLPVALQNYYAADVVKKLLAHPSYRLSDNGGNLIDLFGRVVSDMQVRAPIRILVRQLRAAGVPASRVLRYRVAFRPGFFDGLYPPEAGVTHGADLYFWWACRRFGFADPEWEATKAWLDQTQTLLVKGEDFPVTTGEREYLLLGPEGKASVVEDVYWDGLMSVMEAIEA